MFWYWRTYTPWNLTVKLDGWKMKYFVWTVKFPGCNLVFQHWFFLLKTKSVPTFFFWWFGCFFVQKGPLAVLKGAVHFAMALWVGRILPLLSVRSDHVLVPPGKAAIQKMHCNYIQYIFWIHIAYDRLTKIPSYFFLHCFQFASESKSHLPSDRIKNHESAKLMIKLWVTLTRTEVQHLLS